LKGATYVICKEGKRKITNHATGSGYQKAKSKLKAFFYLE